MGRYIRIAADAGMTVLLLLMMAYGKAGEAAHEYLGIGIFVLFVLHHVLSRRWCRNLFRGSYTPFRVLQTLLVALVLATMAGSMASGVILSRHAFSFLHIRGGHAAARVIHMLSAYWGYVFLALHFGVHWCMMAGMAKRCLFWIRLISVSGMEKRKLCPAGISCDTKQVFEKGENGR